MKTTYSLHALRSLKRLDTALTYLYRTVLHVGGAAVIVTAFIVAHHVLTRAAGVGL